MSGVLLVLVGIWGGLVPLIGPYLHFAYTPDKAWTVTTGRIWLEILPGVVAVVGGVMVAGSKLRPWAMLGASLGVISGAWFAFGNGAIRVMFKNPQTAGTPVGGSVIRALEHFGFFTGVGTVLIAVGAVALGRLSIMSVRDSRIAERDAAAMSPEPVSTEPVRAEPITTEPVMTEPVTTVPVTTEPVTSEPVTTEPVTETSARSDDSAATVAGLPKRQTQRKTPMASLVRRASRDKSDSPVEEDDVTKDRLTSGSSRS